MRALISGGLGFIGSHLVERLIKLGYDVTVIDDFSTGTLQNIKFLNHKKIVKASKITVEHVEDVDVVFHLGIPSSSPMYRENPFLIVDAVNNFLGLLELAKTLKFKIVYASTSSLYNENATPFHENMHIHVTDYYTEARYMIERLAELYFWMHGVESVGLRLFSVYGPREEHKGKYANMVSQFLWSILKDESPIIFGDGLQSRDFIYVDDVVNAFEDTLQGNFGCEIFNVGTGVSYSFNQLVKLINELTGKQVKPTYKPNPIRNYVHDTCADTYKTVGTLRFKAQIGLREGIQKLLASH